MARGRKTQPDAIKALRGNPGKRKLLLEHPTLGNETEVGIGKPAVFTVPDFLVHPRERAIFSRIVEDYLQRRIARHVDLLAYGRWASYLHRWMECKEKIDGKNTFYTVTSKQSGTRYARVPLFADMLDLERVMVALEDRLALNPSARQSIIRGLAQMPVGPIEGDKSEPEPPPEPSTKAMPADAGPLGFLETARKLN